MGYRSDVAYTIRFDKVENYHLFILEAKARLETAGALSEVECDDTRLRIDFKADNVKWYESYPDVQMHEKLIEQAEAWCEADTHIAMKEGELEASLTPYRVSYVFVRIGEGDDDNERRTGGDYDYDWLYISRTIVGD